MKKAIAFIISIIFILTIFASSAFSASADTAEPLPSAYNHDTQNLSYITSVKSQDEFGNCWAFAAIACCEAEAVKNHGAPLSTDLSELHLTYFAYNGERNTGDRVEAKQAFYENGGYPELSIFTFSNWIGLVDESVAQYSSLVANPNIKLDHSLMYGNVKYYINNVHNYSLPTDMTKVKEAIRTYGAVQTAYYSNDSYYNKTTYSHYCPQAYTSDHAVTIVGWDDTYNKDNFKSSARPQSNGAWLVKNSWGTDWGDDGYFWLSYEDKSVTTATAYDVTPSSDHIFDNNYQYDGGISLTLSKYDKTAAANIFTAKGNEELMAVSVTTLGVANADYTLKIYRNPDKLTPSAFNKGTPVHTQSGKIENIGFTTIPLTDSVTLNKDDIFIVLIETNAHLALDASQSITSGSTVLATSTASVLKDQTYLSINDSGFYDPITTEMPFNARIKAFTKNLVLGSAEFVSAPVATSIEFGQPLSASALSGGEVVDSLSRKAIAGTWSFADSSAIVENGEKVTVIFTPENPSYSTVTKEISITVTPSTPKLTLTTDSQSYRGGDTVGVSATVKNEHSSTLTDLPEIKLYYQINDGEKIFFTDSFTLPESLRGKKITIAAVTDAVEDKYTEAIKSISFSTDSATDDGSDTPNGSDTQKPGGSADTDNSQSNSTQNNNQSTPNITNKETSAQPGSETEAMTDSSLKNDIENDVNTILDNSINGCFASASLSAMLTVSAIFGLALIKKKKYD